MISETTKTFLLFSFIAPKFSNQMVIEETKKKKGMSDRKGHFLTSKNKAVLVLKSKHWNSPTLKFLGLSLSFFSSISLSKWKLDLYGIPLENFFNHY